MVPIVRGELFDEAMNKGKATEASALRRARVGARLWMVAGLLLFVCSVPPAIYWHMLKDRIFTHGKLSSQYLGGIRQAVVDAAQSQADLAAAADSAHKELLDEAGQIHDDINLIVLLLGELAAAGVAIAYLAFKLSRSVRAERAPEIGTAQPRPNGVLPKS